MAIEDLKEAGLLLPEEEWGKYELKTTVNTAALSGVGILGIISVAMMYLGDGHWPTWLGVLLFLLSLIAFLIISLVGIEKQNEIISSSRETYREESHVTPGDKGEMGSGMS